MIQQIRQLNWASRVSDHRPLEFFIAEEAAKARLQKENFQGMPWAEGFVTYVAERAAGEEIDINQTHEARIAKWKLPTKDSFSMAAAA
jgi:hypothetical protein